MGIIKVWFLRWFPGRTWRVIDRVEDADDVARRLPRVGAVLVASGTVQKWLIFDCPCHRGHRIMLNLDGARSPVWNIVSVDPLTIAPSVDAQFNSVRCHYFIQEGEVRWV